MSIISVTTKSLPIVNYFQQLYMTATLELDGTLVLCTITEMQLLYGNVNLSPLTSSYIPLDNQPCAIIVIGTYYSDITLLYTTYSTIYYGTAINIQQLPNNLTRLIQKLPYGIFRDTSQDTIIGNILLAISQMIDDYYKQYFYVKNQVFSTNYSSELEVEYNGTSGLLSNSYDVNNLFLLFSQMKQYGLNIYDLELFISQYIYFRVGKTCPIWINDGVIFNAPYWVLGDEVLSILGSTTVLSNGNIGKPNNIIWNIYNTSNTAFFTLQFKTEITNLIIRISRADIGNTVIFYDDVIPPDFTYLGATYQTDPRTLQNRCIQYLGPYNYPMNIVGYTKSF